MKHTRKKALAVLSAILLLLSGTVQSVLAEEAAVPTSAEKADATATEKVLSDLGVEEGRGKSRTALQERNSDGSNDGSGSLHAERRGIHAARIGNEGHDAFAPDGSN